MSLGDFETLGPRIVFFGLPGPFAVRPLEALIRSGLPPILVVEGLERSEVPPRGWTRFEPARPSPLTRTFGAARDKLAQWTGLPLAAAPARSLTVEAHRHGLDVLRTDDANRGTALRHLARARADAFLVCGFPHLLSPRTLGLAARGGLNLHPGRLPEERGPSPLFWALKAGRTDLSWTLHVLDQGEDAGDVVATGQRSFEPGQRGDAILEALAVDAAPTLVRSVRSLLDGDLVRSPQPPPSGLRARRPTFRDGRIDPGRPAERIYTFVAGCAGRYPLFVESAGDRYFIEDALSFDSEASLAFEYALTGDRLLLRCAPGVVELKLKVDGALFAADY